MYLSGDQVALLRGDLDYILPRTSCNMVPLTKGFLLRELERDPDVLLDLVDGMSPGDARSLSVPHDTLRSLILRRRMGYASGRDCSAQELFSGFAE